MADLEGTLKGASQRDLSYGTLRFDLALGARRRRVPKRPLKIDPRSGLKRTRRAHELIRARLCDSHSPDAAVGSDECGHYIVVARIVVAHIVMAHIVVAHIVMAQLLPM